jgi:hypothetical protein
MTIIRMLLLGTVCWAANVATHAAESTSTRNSPMANTATDEKSGLFDDRDSVVFGAKAVWIQGLPVKYSPIFSLRGHLPTYEGRMALFLGRAPTESVLTARTDTDESDPRTTETTTLGADFSFLRGLKQQVSMRGGARVVSGELDPYLRLDYRLQLRNTENRFMRFMASPYLRTSDTMGITLGLSQEFLLQSGSIVRWHNEGTFSKNETETPWRSTLALHRSLGNRRSVQWEAKLRGRSESENVMMGYSIGVDVRQDDDGRGGYRAAPRVGISLRYQWYRDR